MIRENTFYDIAVIGAGSGGIGTALSAARLGLKVLLVEKYSRIGGTAAWGGVNNWEPGVGGTGIPFEIYKRLTQIPKAVGIYTFGRHISWPEHGKQPYPGGECVIDHEMQYLNTLQRFGTQAMKTKEETIEFMKKNWHGVIFEPAEYCCVVEQMLDETGNCTLLKDTAFIKAKVKNDSVTKITLENGTKISAHFFVDATAGLTLAEACGCESMIGKDSHDTFEEPDAPKKISRHLNAATLIYRVSRKYQPGIEPLPEGIPSQCWWAQNFPIAFVGTYPNGDLNINMLPTMEGREAFDMMPMKANIECRRRVLAHWHYNQTNFKEYQQYRITWIAPILGLREERRIAGRYILTEHDLRDGLTRQKHPDIIAIADHAMDIHGVKKSSGRNCSEVKEPYGIPYRCLLPRGVNNLMVACRGASFSSIAASSCRLSRTMMQLGQAAGTAAFIAKNMGLPLSEIPGEKLRTELRKQHVQLEWPMSEDLKDYISCSFPESF